MPKVSASALRPEVSRPLLASAESIAKVAPWEFMSDLELLGMRDQAGNLYVASILGTLGTIFAVVIYRNDAGLRWIHDLVASRAEPDLLTAPEDLDYLKIEWCPKKELREHDLKTLELAGLKPKGRGAVWPRFESSRPGWYPWSLDEAEARLMTDLLQKVARFIRLRERIGMLHEEPIASRVPIIPAGEECTLRAEEIEWHQFVPRPALALDPMVLSGEKEHDFAGLPIREGFIAEILAPLAPAMAFMDEKAGRPCLARLTLVIDRPTQYVLASHMAHGAAPLREAVGPAFTKALHQAKARPESICVDNAGLAAVLRPACKALGVPLIEAPLEVAPQAFAEIEEHFSRRRPS